MKEVDGIIVTAKIASEVSPIPRNMLIGPSVNPNMFSRGWEVLTMNDLTTFESVNDASRIVVPVLEELVRHQRVHQVGMASLYLNIAEHYDEWERLNPRLPYILIVDGEFGTINLYGMPVEGAPRVGYIPVTFLEDNGLRGWKDLDAVKRAHEEYGRQGGRSGKIANFKFRRVPIGSVRGRLRP